MYELTLVKLIIKLQQAVIRFAMNKLNKRSEKNLVVYNRRHQSAQSAREALDEYEAFIESDFQEKEDAIVSAYTEIRQIKNLSKSY